MQPQRQSLRLSKVNQVSNVESPSTGRKTELKKTSHGSTSDNKTKPNKKVKLAYAPDNQMEQNKKQKIAYAPGFTQPQFKMNKTSSSEGQCYIISNFGVAENGGRLPLVRNRWRISFYKGTEVTRMEQIDENFIGFVNEPFSRILDTNNEYHEHDCVDVVGTVVAIGNIVAVNGYGCSKFYRTVVIEDAYIQYESGWCYTGCKACNTKVTPIPTKGASSLRNKKQLWHCKKHGETYPVVSRFKIIVHIFDESGSAQQFGTYDDAEDEITCQQNDQHTEDAINVSTSSSTEMNEEKEDEMPSNDITSMTKQETKNDQTMKQKKKMMN
ncbi:replication protein A 70 kDa DNA-binding subunit B [Tanacetum coccineum]